MDIPGVSFEVGVMDARQVYFPGYPLSISWDIHWNMSALDIYWINPTAVADARLLAGSVNAWRQLGEESSILPYFHYYI